jgi:hypothetical protein
MPLNRWTRLLERFGGSGARLRPGGSCSPESSGDLRSTAFQPLSGRNHADLAGGLPAAGAGTRHAATSAPNKVARIRQQKVHNVEYVTSRWQRRSATPKLPGRLPLRRRRWHVAIMPARGASLLPFVLGYCGISRHEVGTGMVGLRLAVAAPPKTRRRACSYAFFLEARQINLVDCRTTSEMSIDRS